MKRSLRASLLALVLCASMLLSSCSLLEPRIAENGDDPYKTPEICGLWGAREINELLDEHFSSVAGLLEQGNSLGQVASLQYELEETADGFLLHSWLEGAIGQKVRLSDVSLGTSRCEIPEPALPEVIGDPIKLSKIMNLSSRGFEVDLWSLDKELRINQVIPFLVSYYESMVGHTIDHSSVSRSDLTDINALKYLALAPDSLPDLATKCTAYDILIYLEPLMTDINFHAYGLGSQGFTLAQYIRVCELFLNMFEPDVSSATSDYTDMYTTGSDFIPSAVTESSSDLWDIREDWLSLVSKTDLSAVVNGQVLMETEPITRLKLAQAAVAMITPFHEPKKADRYSGFKDTTSKSASYAVGLGLMDCLPRSTDYFEPEYTPSFSELPKLASRFATNSYTLHMSKHRLLLESYISAMDLADICFKLDSYYAGMVKFVGERREAVNDRDYDWYRSQHDTGEYSSVNCMPTISAMAIIWRDEHSPVTPEALRNLFLPKYKSGWWLEQVKDSLTAYEVGFAHKSVKLEDMLADLDAGNILLLQFSEAAPDKSGHCMVIYGYEKVGDSVNFIVHDPDVYNGTRSDGNPAGKGLHINSAYLLWTVERITDSYLNVFSDSSQSVEMPIVG